MCGTTAATTALLLQFTLKEVTPHEHEQGQIGGFSDRVKRKCGSLRGRWVLYICLYTRVTQTPPGNGKRTRTKANASSAPCREPGPATTTNPGFPVRRCKNQRLTYKLQLRKGFVAKREQKNMLLLARAIGPRMLKTPSARFVPFHCP